VIAGDSTARRWRGRSLADQADRVGPDAALGARSHSARRPVAIEDFAAYRSF
jgi:hypothetical protein